MTKTLHDLGDEIYGTTPPPNFKPLDTYPWWTHLMVMDLGTTNRSVRRWLSGEWDTPASVRDQLAELAAAKVRVRNKKGG